MPAVCFMKLMQHAHRLVDTPCHCRQPGQYCGGTRRNASDEDRAERRGENAALALAITGDMPDPSSRPAELQANNTAVDLALAHPATPRNPYTQPAGPKDTPSQMDAPWTGDAQTQQWSRTVTDQVMERGLKNEHTETATPQRAMKRDSSSGNTLKPKLKFAA